MPVLVVGQLATTNGPRQVGFVNGISDNLYAFDVEAGKILWKKHWDYTLPDAPATPQSGPGSAKHLGFLRPGGSSDTPVIGPADAQGRRALYFVSGDGMGSRIDQYGPGAALQLVSIVCVILTVIFGGLYLYFKARGGYRAIQLATDRPLPAGEM